MQESFRPDRVQLILPMISFLPEESLQRLSKMFGHRLEGLTALESQALVTAEVEGKVSNSRLQEVCTDHPADLSRTLQGLVANGFLEQVGKGRWCEYRLPQSLLEAFQPKSRPEEAMFLFNDAGSGGNDVGLTTNDVSSPSNDLSSPANDATKHIPDNESLLAIAQPAREKAKLPPEQMEDLIIALCKGRFLTASELAQLLKRGPGTTRKYLTQLVKRQALRMKYPEDPSHPEQAYKSVMENPA